MLSYQSLGRWVRVALVSSLCCGWSGAVEAAEPTVPAKLDFARDVRPILAQHCGSCHGPDETTREAKLRLDERDSATAVREGGRRAIVPGDPAKSLVVERILHADPDVRMPPADAKKPLAANQIEILRRWIAEGGLYAQHWAFAAPQRPAVPTVARRAASNGPIDQYVVATLERQGLGPAPRAARETLVRRVALDLTGLPPTPELVADFLSDSGPDAYERLVDRLLASPRYAERMAMQWLDAARYADTNGYNNDEERSMWPWRDWVIRAFQKQMPFDQFVVQQMAGDLLPEPTLDQKVATGFHRNHVLTTEGGIIEEEYRVEYVADRVHTTATVFLGLSLQCARCHDHKYDPFTQREYYQLFAFFNQLPHQPAVYARGGVADPSVKVPTSVQQDELARLAQRQRELKSRLDELEQTADARIAAWERQLSDADRQNLGPLGLQLHLPLDERAGDRAVDPQANDRVGVVKGKPNWTEGRRGGALDLDGQTYVDAGQGGAFEADEPFSLAAWVLTRGESAAAVLSKMDDAQSFRGYDITIENGRVASHLIDHWADNGLKVITKSTVLPRDEWHHVLVTYDGSRKAAGMSIYIDGQPQPLEISNDKLTGSIRTDKPLHLGRRQNSLGLNGRLDDVRFYGRTLSADEAQRLFAGEEIGGLKELLAVPAADRTPVQRRLLQRYYLDQVDSNYRTVRAELADVPRRQSELEKAVPAVMIMQDQTETRVTHLLRRGQYDQPGDAVRAAVPSLFAPLAEGAPANRLSLARWLVAPTHPLTARVAVNRWWESYFGLGIVETLEDFGVTGAFPSHPELLDWLATELIRTEWDTLAMQRAIVSSGTYRQSSHASAADLQRDPKNQGLSRGPRYRLSAESVRDNALAVSGLLVERLGGPSVKPYQPDGLWEDVSVERRYKYQIDPGGGLYRRSMYTFWKRTCPPPTMSTFDAPTRETCTIRRARTNTPLQALVLLNDPTYVEAARKFAERVLREAPESTFDARLSTATRLALARAPRPVEREVFQQALAEAQTHYQKAPDQAEKLLTVGRAPRDPSLAVAELAAWAVVCDMLLNLDEAITKP